MGDNRYQTVNTFTQRPSIPQVCAYVVFIAEVVVFYAAILPSYYDQATMIVITTLYSSSLAGMIAFSFIASISDPSDRLMVKCRNGQKSQQTMYDFRISPQELRSCFECARCQSHVSSTAKHCRSCDRCVQKFDHHCVWINNCIGSANYQYFAIMLAITWINLTLFMVAVIVLSSENRWIQFLGKIIVCWVVLGVVFALWFLLSNLIFFHIYLTYMGLTTFQFIVKRNEEKKRAIRQTRAQQTISHDMTSQIFRQANSAQKSQLPIMEGETNGHIDPQRWQSSHQQSKRAPLRETNLTKVSPAYKQQQPHLQSSEFLQIHQHRKQIIQQQIHSQNNNNEEAMDDLPPELLLNPFFSKNKSLEFVVGEPNVSHPKKPRPNQNITNSIPLNKQFNEERK